MRKLTRNQNNILEYLKKRNYYVTPTEIGKNVGGMMIGDRGVRGSSWASPICKRLVELGLIERNVSGWYKAK